MAIVQERLDYTARLYCEPLTLIMNFALFQYLCGMYYKRRREPRVRVLVWFGSLGFLSLIPFANPDMRVFDHLNNVSEACSTMTFLVQITIIGRDVHKKVHIRSLRWLTYLGEVLILIGLVLTLKNFIELFTTQPQLERSDFFDNIVEDASLVYIFVFRFYYIGISKGVKWLIYNRKTELLLYTLFITHEYPFMALQSATGVSWESVQALWHRITMTMCVLQTIKEKIRSSTSNRSARHGPKTHASRFESNAPTSVAAATSSPMAASLRLASRKINRQRSKTTTKTQTLSTAFSFRALTKGSVTPIGHRSKTVSGPKLDVQ